MRPGQQALVTVRLGQGVNVDLDEVGEIVSAVIVDGIVARILVGRCPIVAVSITFYIVHYVS